MLKQFIINEIERVLDEDNIDLKIVRFLTTDELKSFNDYNGKRFKYHFLPIATEDIMPYTRGGTRFYLHSGNENNVKFYINDTQITRSKVYDIVQKIFNSLRNSLEGQVFKFETAYIEGESNVKYVDKAYTIADISEGRFLSIDHAFEKINDNHNVPRSWLRTNLLSSVIDFYSSFLNFNNISNDRDFDLGLLFMTDVRLLRDAINFRDTCTTNIENVKLDTTLSFDDLKNIDWANTNSENHNRVYVIRRSKYAGSFDVDTETAYINFYRCGKTNYLTTRLRNEYNERNRLYIDYSLEYFTIYARDNLSYKCDKCGLISFKPMENGLCSSCLNVANKWGIDVNLFKMKKYEIMSYSHQSDIDFFLDEETESANPLFLGVELEVDSDGQPEENECGCGDEDCDVCNDYENSVSVPHDDNVDIVLHTLNGYTTDFSMAKSDGSLNSGFEIVSQPATLKAHFSGKHSDWSNTFRVLKRLGYRSHDAETCGLHVHINRNFFGDNRATQNYNGAKMVYLLEAHWDDFVKFSRRSRYHIDRWAKRENTKKDFDEQYLKSPMTLRDAFRKNYDRGNKYVALNTLHYNTFEFRIFRGTLNEATFKATLQLVDNLARLVKKTTLSKLTSISFDDIINFKKQPELLTYWDLRSGNGEDND